MSEHVNPARTDFDLELVEDDDDEQPQLDLRGPGIKRADIRDKCIECIHADLSKVIRTINEEKEEKIRQFVQTDAPQYKIL